MRRFVAASARSPLADCVENPPGQPEGIFHVRATWQIRHMRSYDTTGINKAEKQERLPKLLRLRSVMP
ncbi:hypothetical protein [Lihuaxuella thermophila]|uniref:hypothetical protein n=1 Tax=Lihuaxuella thermophila TaxID=1173111 RepID=UPI000B7DFD42|nr:hypothetical protein [Lihuaxuella thermophila]